jgi:hypothetical protein
MWDPTSGCTKPKCRKKPPPDFEAVRQKDGKIWYFCTHKEQGEDGSSNRCVYKVREDRLQAKDLHHTHQLGLFNFPTATHVNEAQFRRNLTGIVGQAASELGWSMRSVMSRPFRHMIEDTLKLGRMILDDRPFGRDAIDRALSYRELRRNIITHGTQSHEQRIDDLRSYRYCSLAVDRGTIATHSFYDVFACNAGMDLDPALMDSHQNLPKNAQTVQDCLTVSFHKCQKAELVPVFIVADNEKAQRLGIDNLIKELSSDSFLRFLPCVCHTICLAMNDVFSDCAEFSKEIRAIRTVSKLYNHLKTDVLLPICPSHVATRWIFDFDYRNSILPFFWTKIVNKFYGF